MLGKRRKPLAGVKLLKEGDKMSPKKHNNKDERKMHVSKVIDLNEYRQSKLNKIKREKYKAVKQKIIMMAQKTNW